MPGQKIFSRIWNFKNDLDFPNASFDLVACSDMIEHISNDALAFAEIARLTKKNGIILFTVPYASQKNRDSCRNWITSDQDIIRKI